MCVDHLVDQPVRLGAVVPDGGLYRVRGCAVSASGPTASRWCCSLRAVRRFAGSWRLLLSCARRRLVGRRVLHSGVCFRWSRWLVLHVCAASADGALRRGVGCGQGSISPCLSCWWPGPGRIPRPGPAQASVTMTVPRFEMRAVGASEGRFTGERFCACPGASPEGAA